MHAVLARCSFCTRIMFGVRGGLNFWKSFKQWKRWEILALTLLQNYHERVFHGVLRSARSAMFVATMVDLGEGKALWNAVMTPKGKTKGNSLNDLISKVTSYVKGQGKGKNKQGQGKGKHNKVPDITVEQMSQLVDHLKALPTDFCVPPPIIGTMGKCSGTMGKCSGLTHDVVRLKKQNVDPCAQCTQTKKRKGTNASSAKTVCANRILCKP